jgi:uncharacterized protein YprB with RNaseH-like and TPR domain
MVETLRYWSQLYEKLKFESFCLDIETSRYNGPISVIGLYRPADGPVECLSLVRGQNLSLESLKTALQDAKMLVTYNGLRHDIPMIRREFPGAIPGQIPVIDLYRFARRLEMNTNLKVLETTMGIDRLEDSSKRRGMAIRRWRRYREHNDQDALAKLLEYNKQDTINLYPLAEQLVAMVKERLSMASK